MRTRLQMKKKNRRVWSQAPTDILNLIAERLKSVEDFVRFGAVCKSSQKVITNQRKSKYSPKTLPWLMLPLSSGEQDHVPSFYSVPSNACFTSYLPELRSRYFTGSQYGLVVDMEELELFNPLTRKRIPLPELPVGGQHDMARFTRLFMSSLGKYIVVIGMGKELRFVREGDLGWTTVEIVVDNNRRVVDVLWLNNELYIVDKKGRIRRADSTSPNPVARKFVEAPGNVEGGEMSFYLLEVMGELHMVVKFDVIEDARRYYVRVFKLDLNAKNWEELSTLGDYTFFVGRNSSFSIRTSGYDFDFEDFRHGCVHLNDTVHSGWNTTSDIWIFNIENGDMDVLPTYGDENISLFSCPAWFTPNLC